MTRKVMNSAIGSWIVDKDTVICLDCLDYCDRVTIVGHRHGQSGMSIIPRPIDFICPKCHNHTVDTTTVGKALKEAERVLKRAKKQVRALKRVLPKCDICKDLYTEIPCVCNGDKREKKE